MISFAVVLLTLLPAVLSSNCYQTGCECSPGHDVRCRNGAVDRIPSNLSSDVRILDLSMSTFASPIIQQSNFSGLPNLRTLNLRGCGINHIDYNSFIGNQRLESLDLSLNNLHIIPEGSFSDLRLEYLYLDDNPSINLQEKTFSSMTVEVLSIKNCNIATLSARVFQPIEGSLRKIFLESNKIERIPYEMEAVFSTTKIETVRIAGNPLICDCELKWLKQFYDLNVGTSLFGDTQQGSAQDPRCSNPPRASGSFFSRLTLDDFGCDKPTIHANINFTKKEGILSCVSRGNPLPTVAWVRPNGVISRSSPQGNMVANTNSIELLASDQNVNGQYRCIASNEGGNVSLTVNVDWPFQTVETDNSDGQNGCNTETTTKIVDVPNSDKEAQVDVFKANLFTIVDIVGAILGTFVCTLIVTVVTLHFCVYRRRKPSKYATPAMSEYSSSSNGSDKNGPYPLSLHSLQASQMQAQRPLPNKPYHKIYDENHYMATNIEERDEFLRLSANHTNGRATPASSCDTCPACRTMPQNHHIS